MIAFWTVAITFFLLNIIVIHGNRVRRHRRQTLNRPLESMSQKSLSSTPRILNNAEQYFAQEEDKNKLVSGKTVGRQFHPHQRHYGYGSIQAINSPFSGSGVGLYQYGYGEYGQLGQGSGQYAAYYNNRYPGSYGFYPGFNSVGYYGSNNHAPPGGNNYGYYMWNDGRKHNMNRFYSTYIKIIS
ncbi:unnamed protein product [Rotaria socialis]|uniref:Uncharacterized protein n=1 Tax=Rotaria socialis TaxID=392032 RepID=A0A817YH21_9BILA|nr:unnamed protein product [Rotaria socialis]CAF3688354.1 unnamed protein product [Rotaria socialis]CAF3757260.1 unnamed protein product [Rotaria socialis]